MNLLKTIVLVGLLSLGQMLLAQESADFPLKKINDHFFFKAQSSQGDSLLIMLESSLPAFLVNRDFYDQNRAVLHFDSSESKIRLLNELYNISFVAKGVVPVGNAVYDGPIFVLEDFVGYRMPIQFLRLPSDTNALLLVDLPNSQLSVLPQSVANSFSGTSYPLEMDQKVGFPVVEDTIRVLTDSGNFTLQGRLIVDFGCPMLLFLRKQHSSVVNAMDQGTLVLQDAYNDQGVAISQGFIASGLSFLGRNFQGMTIGVTDRMSALNHLGFLGIPFFDAPVLFDFKRQTMTILK